MSTSHSLLYLMIFKLMNVVDEYSTQTVRLNVNENMMGK